ncbi:MAG: fibronectin type III domain-containing protein [Flavobacteriaceae bacterium]
MKTKVLLFGIFLWCCFSLTAQTTHFIDWELSVGSNATITIDVGDEIVWTNVEGALHNVVSSDPDAPAGFGSGTMNLGDTYSFTFNNPVVFDYGCGFHPGTMDGTITVSATCDPPTNLTLDDVTQTTADISWTASATETNGYSWVVMNMGDDPDIDTPVASGNVATGVTTAQATGLMADTMYQAYVKTDCGANGESTWSASLNIQTDQEICDSPTNLTDVDITTTTADISWTASATETNGYNWAVFNSGDDPLTDIPVTDGNVATGITMAQATGLTENTVYDFYVVTLCDIGLESDLAGPLTFTTETLGVNNNTLIGFEYYPNPTSGIIYLKTQNTIKSATVHNVLGQRVIRQEINKNAAEINISLLKYGTYFLKVIDADNNSGVVKILKK